MRMSSTPTARYSSGHMASTLLFIFLHNWSCLQVGNYHVVFSAAFVTELGSSEHGWGAVDWSAEQSQRWGTCSEPPVRPSHVLPPAPAALTARHLPSWWPGLHVLKGQNLMLLYPRLFLGFPSLSRNSFVYVCKLSERDMEVTRENKSGTLKCLFYSHISNHNCPLKPA